MNYKEWDSAIESAISTLVDDKATSRAQTFIKKFPKALTTFREHLSQTRLAIPFADFQHHPTYLLRWLLAEWKDEEAKVLRTDLDIIIRKSTARIQRTQEWRSGVGPSWEVWGFKGMDDMYANYKTPIEQDTKVSTWFPQQFFGLDTLNHPLHLELLPNTYDEKLVLSLTLRRIVNNEHTFRYRIPWLNPPPAHLLEAAGISPDPRFTTRPDVLSNPILGATWVLDGRNLSMWYSSAIYKTASVLIEKLSPVFEAHYPEQGYRTLVLNLGLVLGGLYNMAIKVMPPTVQEATRCFVGNDGLAEVMGGWENVPGMYKEPKTVKLTKEEEEKFKHDVGPFVIR